MTDIDVLMARALRDPEVKAKYDRLGPIYVLVFELVEARHRAGLTQAQLAERMGTTQSAIARLENARHMPSLGMAARYAEAMGQRLDIHLEAAE
jgi:DNA-binding XRE family transcriptional regulator